MEPLLSHLPHNIGWSRGKRNNLFLFLLYKWGGQKHCTARRGETRRNLFHLPFATGRSEVSWFRTPSTLCSVIFQRGWWIRNLFPADPLSAGSHFWFLLKLSCILGIRRLGYRDVLGDQKLSDPWSAMSQFLLQFQLQTCLEPVSWCTLNISLISL